MKLLKYEPHQKIKYSAGLISLALLPILCLCWIYKYEVSKVKHAVDIVFWSPEAKETVPEDYWPETLAKKKTTIIDLTGNNSNDKISLQYAQVLLSNWKANKDDTQVIKFHFGNKAKYWTFVEAINVCKAVKLNSYLPYKNNMYAYWDYHPKSVQKPVYRFFCGTMYLCQTMYTKEPVDWWLEIGNYLKNYWVLGIGFISLMTLSIVQFKKFRSNMLV
jgi:hypothetical protein